MFKRKVPSEINNKTKFGRILIYLLKFNDSKNLNNKQNFIKWKNAYAQIPFFSITRNYQASLRET